MYPGAVAAGGEGDCLRSVDSYLEQYLDLIEKELNKFANLVRRHRKPIVRSIHKLTELQEKRTRTEGKEGSE